MALIPTPPTPLTQSFHSIFHSNHTIISTIHIGHLHNSIMIRSLFHLHQPSAACGKVQRWWWRRGKPAMSKGVMTSSRASRECSTRLGSQHLIQTPNHTISGSCSVETPYSILCTSPQVSKSADPSSPAMYTLEYSSYCK
jgi:hypothetical protein